MCETMSCQVLAKQSLLTQISRRSIGNYFKTNKAYKKPNRHKPGALASREIRRLRRSTTPIINSKLFHQFVFKVNQRDIPDKAIESDAVEIMQESCEIFLTSLFENANLCAIHARRNTVLPEDLQLVMHIGRDWELENIF